MLEFTVAEASSRVGSWRGVRMTLSTGRIAHYCFLLLSFFHSCICISVVFYAMFPSHLVFNSQRWIMLLFPVFPYPVTALCGI